MPPRARRRLRLGYTEDGREFSLAVRGRNVLIAGDAKSGKSWLAGLLCEQLILHGYCVCVIDPEGDYRSLEALPGVTVLGGEDPPPTPRELLRALRYPDRSVVIDLSHVPQDEKIDYIRSVLPALNVMRRRTGLPHRILLDEAHYFLHDAAARHLLDLDSNGYTVVTYCASRLPPELLAATEVMLVTCESNPAEIDALWQRCAACQQVDPAGGWRLSVILPLGQAVALPITEEAGGELKLFTIGQRLTPHVRHRQKYVDVPVTESRAFGSRPRRAPHARTHAAAVRGCARARLRRRARPTCAAATFHAGSPTCSATTRWPQSCGSRNSGSSRARRRHPARDVRRHQGAVRLDRGRRRLAGLRLETAAAPERFQQRCGESRAAHAPDADRWQTCAGSR